MEVLIVNNIIAMCLLLNLTFFARFLSSSIEYQTICEKTVVLTGNLRFKLYSLMRRFWEVVNKTEDKLTGKKSGNINYFQF